MCTSPPPSPSPPPDHHNHHVQLTPILAPSRRILLGLRPRQTPRLHLQHRLPLRPNHRPTLHRRLLLRHPPNPHNRPLRARKSPSPNPRPKSASTRRKAKVFGPDGRSAAVVQGRRVAERVSRVGYDVGTGWAGVRGVLCDVRTC